MERSMLRPYTSVGQKQIPSDKIGTFGRYARDDN
jgi:hypothetical protein